jgi:hypothetical protein
MNEQQKYIRQIVETALFFREMYEEGNDGSTTAIALLKPIKAVSNIALRKYVLHELYMNRNLNLTDVAIQIAIWDDGGKWELPFKLEDIEGELREICHSHERPIKFIKDELSKSVRINRSFLRAARYIKRIQNDEKAPAHSRVVELFIPDEFVPKGAGKNGLGHREHVVPCVLLRDKCVELFRNGAIIEEVADFLKRYVVIVEISPSQQHSLDASKSKGGRGLKHCMPEGWEFESGCIFARLHDANILFDPPQGFTACYH